MKVILLQKVAGLGEAEEVKEVSDGYARNFLFPHHLAVQASLQAVDRLSAQKKKRTKEAELELRAYEKLAEDLDGLELDISQKTNEQGLLYAALNAQKIVEVLSGLGYRIDKKYVDVPIIKETGDFKVFIHLPHGLEAELRVHVTNRAS